MEEKKQHFVLVHGGGHGAWCWWKLVPLLEQAGHRVSAIDLASGGDTASEISADDIETFEQYNRPLQQLFKSLPQGEKVILVGHSMGGINVSYMTENYSNQIVVSVYIAAFMLPSDMGTLEAGIKNNRQDKHLGIILHSKRGPDHPPTSYCFTRQALQERVYSLCSPEDLEVAAEKVRPGPMSYQVVSGRLHHSADRYGTVPRVFIMCEKDLVIRLPSAERMVKLNPPKEVIRLPHADHMPFVSVTKDLHYHLADIAQRYG